MNHHKNLQKPTNVLGKQTKHGQASHQVRIIGGVWKRTPLTVISANGLRPTPDRVRETVFNWLHHLFAGQWGSVRCLDMFSGSGALGFEAASRGARQVCMFEAYPPAFRQLEQVKVKLRAEQVELIRGDALLLAQHRINAQEQFDVIFLDPPFHQNMLEKILPLCLNLLAQGGVIYVESETVLAPDLLGSDLSVGSFWQVIRQDKAGTVHFHLLQRSTETGEAV
ncbi:16S rRNA (guanine(966)-N(2))-methyltransferase RsmD [Undibacterium fentianense]|uniref:16S rRNA (Guanine(966)-N(2))-methyltransferase RsmD n=1 Tax=Undibacterium fentianense TaxID=2828728 RepID=A0A941E4A0_9BURK|nr:16S rRNA (guanine(966)-N(2))-methyltransferase RsmD [Undibacterium fentianense]MBR7800756.1 16S rRNA (guanine(966)-N(2))-methyltransferase RsmD [Undibacterium fentianense]